MTKEPAWLRGCLWFCVLFFVFVWTPAVFVSTGRYRFKYTLEPQCFLVLPSDLVKFGPPGFTLGFGVRDFQGVVAKPVPLDRQACLGRSPKSPVKSAEWLGNQTGQGCLLHFHTDHQGDAKLADHTLPLEPEAGIADPDGEHNCRLFADARASPWWRNEDVCALKGDWRGFKTYRSDVNASHCLSMGGDWQGGEEPVAPKSLVKATALTGPTSAWLHVCLGSLYFILGMLELENPGTASATRHRWLGWLYVLVQVAMWVPTWGVILSANKVSVVRVCVNAYGNLYWMYSLYRGIAAARRKQFASHRRWMLRNFSVAVAIIFGRYVGTALLFAVPFSWWRNADTFETLNIIFGWLITFTCLEFYLERSGGNMPASSAKAKAE